MISYWRLVKRCQAATTSGCQCQKEATHDILCGTHNKMRGRVKLATYIAEEMKVIVDDFSIPSTPLSTMWMPKDFWQIRQSLTNKTES